MKKCLKCGTMISDTAGDYCDNCSGENKLTACERALEVLSSLIIVIGVTSSIVLLVTIGKTLEGIIITISTIFSTALLWALLSCAVQTSANIRKIASKK